MLQRQAGCFVPNLGQWPHRGKFVHRTGPMTLFLEDRGWVLDLVQRPVEPKAGPKASPHEHDEVAQKTRGVALRMTFDGDAYVPEIAAEQQLPGHHSYLLGNDKSRWRTDVPLYGSVRYKGLYPGIDLRLRQANGVPEYDLLLQPGADLGLVTVHVEGAEALRISKDGALVIETALGPLTQPEPKTWQVDEDGRKREVHCEFALLGTDRFGFEAPGWDGTSHLTIDPGLIWSTYLGGNLFEWISEHSVDGSGVVTVVGYVESPNFPTTTGAYDTTFNGGGYDCFVTRLDPSKTGKAQLLYSTFLGGTGRDYAYSHSVDAAGVVILAGYTSSTNYPTTTGAYNTASNGSWDAIVSRLDPSKTGTAQLLYSSYLGGSLNDYGVSLAVDASGAVTIAGYTRSTDFPTTTGAYDRTHNGGNYDGFVSRLIPAAMGAAGLRYSTLLGGNGYDRPYAVSVDVTGRLVMVAGQTPSSNFPTTTGAYDTTHNGGNDGFVSRLDTSKTGTAQLLYSTFLGGTGSDQIIAMSVAANGTVTGAGYTSSSTFPTTSGAYDMTHNGGNDAFVSRLIPAPLGAKGLSYSTFLGGSGSDRADALSVDTAGVVTVAGQAQSTDFPVTSGAYDMTHNGSGDAFVSRLDPSKTGTGQLLYSTYLGGSANEYGWWVFVDPSGVATVAGQTVSTNFPTTTGAFSTTYNAGRYDTFLSRLDMGVALYGNLHEVSLSTGGTQKLTVNAGKAHANRSYWIFGSVTGTTPGITLASAIGAVHIPLNPDIWTDYTIGLANTATLSNTKATLDASGTAQAAFNIPKVNLPGAIGVVFYHAYLVYDAKNNFYMASNPVPLKLVK
ncbi:MAG: DUF7948 domain-containing protein [Planctomycetota bacterium]|jgi:hypothetical protein